MTVEQFIKALQDWLDELPANQPITVNDLWRALARIRWEARDNVRL